MMMPDDARLVMPLLNKIAAAVSPVSLSELAEDTELQGLVRGRWEHPESVLRWVAANLQRENLIVDAGGGRFAITQAGVGKLESANGGKAASDRDTMARSYARIDQALRMELLARLYATPPAFFESVVVHLLVAMGYGTGHDGLARHLGKSGDGGVDGVVPLDELGLDSIYIQAKRYRPGTAVSVNDVRDFAGSLEMHKASKGIFATTAAFSRPAQEFAAQISRRIVLIDGNMFCGLMLRHNIGVRMVQSWELKEVDDGYFASAQAGRMVTSQISSASIQPRR
jgi:restriction system protein